MTDKPSKLDTANALFRRGNFYVHLDPRGEGVKVPDQFRSQARLSLYVGLATPIPITDITVNDTSMAATLSFGSGMFYCVVPWDAVFALIGDDDRGVVWEECIPKEAARDVAERPMLRLVR